MICGQAVHRPSRKVTMVRMGWLLTCCSCCCCCWRCCCRFRSSNMPSPCHASCISRAGGSSSTIMGSLTNAHCGESKAATRAPRAATPAHTPTTPATHVATLPPTFSPCMAVLTTEVAQPCLHTLPFTSTPSQSSNKVRCIQEPRLPTNRVPHKPNPSDMAR